MLPFAAVIVLLQAQRDEWTLAPRFDTKAPKQSWATSVEAESDGHLHRAVFNLTRLTKSISDEKVIETFNWERLSIDGQPGVDQDPWEVVEGKQGQLLKMRGDLSSDYRRMLAPTVFIYPEKPVAVGDKWEAEVDPLDGGKKMTYSYDAKSLDTTDGNAALLVSAKLVEAGDQGIQGEGFWWLSRVGKILRFEMKLSNWVVPMAGSEASNVIIRAKAL